MALLKTVMAMNNEKIEAALLAAENYVIRATFDNSDVANAILTLEIARDTALNNAPIWLAESNIAEWKLCIDNIEQFGVAIAFLRKQSELLDGVVDDLAHQAATSPLNDSPHPTQMQAKAGNYRKGRIKVAGLKIAIENPCGSVRKGVDDGGREWKSKLFAHYGYIEKSKGYDGDEMDVFIKENTPTDWSGRVFIINQIEPKTGDFDEHKCMIGYASKEEAIDGYFANYDDDWAGLGSVDELSLENFKLLVGGAIVAFDSASERIKLLGEAQSIIKSQENANPIERIKLAKRLNEISRMVFGQGGVEADIKDALADPKNIYKAVKALEAMLGDDASDERKHIANLIATRNFTEEVIRQIRTKYGKTDSLDSLMPMFNGTKEVGHAIVGVVDARENTLPQQTSLADAERALRIYRDLQGAIFSRNVVLSENAKIAVEKAMVDSGFNVLHDRMVELQKQEYAIGEKIIEAMEKGLPIAEMQEQRSEWIDKYRPETEQIKKDIKKARKLKLKLYDENITDSEHYKELLTQAKELRAQLFGAGEAAIAKLMQKSKVTDEQAQSWLKANCIINENAKKRMNRDGYATIEKDLTDFYKLTGGKLHKVEIITYGKIRASTHDVFGKPKADVYIGANFGRKTLFHELGHNLEHDPKSSALAQAFLLKRRESSNTYSMNELTRQTNYGRHEVAYKDSFFNPYVGKYYKHGETEVFAMALGELSSADGATNLMASDREMFDMVVGYLSQEYDDLSQFNLDIGKAKMDGDAQALAEMKAQREDAVAGFTFDSTDVEEFSKEHLKKSPTRIDTMPYWIKSGAQFEWIGFKVTQDDDKYYKTASVCFTTYRNWKTRKYTKSYVVVTQSIEAGFDPNAPPSFGARVNEGGFYTLSEAMEHINKLMGVNDG